MMVIRASAGPVEKEYSFTLFTARNLGLNCQAIRGSPPTVEWICDSHETVRGHEASFTRTVARSFRRRLNLQAAPFVSPRRRLFHLPER